MSELKSVVFAYLVAPLLYVGILLGVAYYTRGRSELLLYLFTYLFSVMYMVIPCAVTLLVVRLMPHNATRAIVGGVLFLMLYVVSQTATILSIGRALSTPRPDDPGLSEELWHALLTFDEVTKCAFAAAFAAVVLWATPYRFGVNRMQRSNA